ncbi:Histone transcription regulator 3 [Linnemannia exigua]|uniref:Histone transcription regulator 3 n=1 Tax=Linnemannia exigua TaxID=604196 RepID=A0AAD4D978_9FUNG|nr:Histone transcription regulator 3 [Linnemannia exigua]
MIRFTAINDDPALVKTEEEDSAEKCLGIYEEAIRMLQKGRSEDARKSLKDLIDSELLQTIDNNSEVAARGTPVRRLQYLVYMNYASILEEASDNISALQYYLKAITFDNSDNSLWIKIGTLATKEKKYKLARYSLECGLQRTSALNLADDSADQIVSSGNLPDGQLTPSQWVCLETLCEVLYVIGDFTACEEYVRRALHYSPYFDRGQELLRIIRRRLQEQPNGGDEFDHSTLGAPLYLSGIDFAPKKLQLDEPSWENLGEQLLAECKTLTVNLDQTFYNRKLVIQAPSTKEILDVDMEDTTTEDPQPPKDDIISKPELTPPADAKPTEEPTLQEPIVATSAVITATAETGEVTDKEASESEQAALKRKRKEFEERSGLRTSKRVRDKLDQFEVTKKKREEEELEILAKYRIVLSKFGMDLENGYVAGSTPSSLLVEDIFPKGISGLLMTFNRHLERPNAVVQASTTIENVQQHKTNHFAIFTTDKSNPSAALPFQDNSKLQGFINRTNDTNSGGVEYLCDYVMALMSGLTGLEGETNWRRRWPEGLRSIAINALSLIEDELLEYLHQESRTDELDNRIDQRVKFELRLSICELYLDEMVRVTLLPFVSTGKKTKGPKRVDTELIAKLDKHFQRWLQLAGYELDIPLDQHLRSMDESGADKWIKVAALRIVWMLGRYSQCLGNPNEAISRFEECLQLSNRLSIEPVILPNCIYDTIIDAERIQERLGKLKTHQYVMEAERLFEEKDFASVLARLGPVFLEIEEVSQDVVTIDKPIAINSETIGGSLPERLGLMNLLYKSCEALENRSQQFSCAVEMFVLVVETLVNTVTDASEASEVWYLFGKVGQTLCLLRETLQSTNLTALLESLKSQKLQRLLCCVLAMARLGFVNILHQDRLVDDDIKISYSDLLKNRPHLGQFNLVLVRTWLVLLYLLPGWFQAELEKDDSGMATNQDQIMSAPIPLNTQPLDIQPLEMHPETVRRVLSQPLTTNSSTPLSRYSGPSQELYMELIALVHDDLGVREFCGIDNNQLIQLALKVASPMQGSFYRKEENQCYYCFYGISLSVDGQYPIEHSSEPVDFDKQAAIEFYPLLERSLSNRALRGQVRGDLKDAVDRVEEALGSPPYERYSTLEFNRRHIDGYLASEINFAKEIQVHSRNELLTMQQPPSSKLPLVYRSIYAIQGKIFLAQFRNKAKNNQFKPLEDLQHAIDQFQTNLHVNPYCWDSWYSLAICYAFLADENLVFSASDIKNNFSKITDLQRRSFHCFSQAVKLAPKRIGRNGNDLASFLKEEKETVADLGAAWDEPILGSQITDKDHSGDESSDSDNTANTSEVTDSDQEWLQKQAAFWFDFGNLVHGIMSRPMRMEAMRRTDEDDMSDSENTATGPVLEPSEAQVYRFASFCFKRSLLLDSRNWRTLFMLGKCIEKLGGKPKSVLALYRIAADKVPPRSGQPGNERIYDAAYKTISTLTKYLVQDKITPSDAEAIMTMTLAKSKLSVADRESFIFEPPKDFLESVQSDPPSEADILYNGKLRVYRLLCEGLARIRHADKRHWHHRPVYRQACILHQVYHDVERAKTEILSLFQIKSNQKTLVSSVWKPEFERSGKHFVYVGEYTRFLIVLARETNDVELLNSLARKIRRAHGLLLDLKEIWEFLYESYLTLLAELVGPDPTIPVAEVIPRTDFRDKAAIYEIKMFKQESELPGLALLQRLSELKKLNDRMAPEGQMSHLLAVCYSKLFIEVGGLEMFPKELLDRLENPTEYAKEKEKKESEVKKAGVATPYQIASRKYGSNGDESNDEEGEVEEIVDQLKDKEPLADADVKMSEPDKLAGGKQATSPPSTSDADLGKDHDSKADSSANGHPASTVNGNTSLTDATSGTTTELPPIHSPETRDFMMTGATTTDTTTDTIMTVDTDVEMSAPVPEPTSRLETPGEIAPLPAVDLRPKMEDWEIRKKISEAELASRAVAMCRAPPASLKAPQTLQSKLAEQEHAIDGGFESGPEAGAENAFEEGARVTGETANGAVDVVMESLDEIPDLSKGDEGQRELEVNGTKDGKDTDSEKDDTDGAEAKGDDASEVEGEEGGKDSGEDDDKDEGGDSNDDDSEEEAGEDGESEKNDAEDMEEKDVDEGEKDVDEGEKESTEASEDDSGDSVDTDDDEDNDEDDSEEDSDEDMEDNDAEEDLEGDNSDSEEEAEGSDEDGDESNTEEAEGAEEAVADSEEVESEGEEDEDEDEDEDEEVGEEDDEKVERREEDGEEGDEEEEEEEEAMKEPVAVGPESKAGRNSNSSKGKKW